MIDFFPRLIDRILPMLVFCTYSYMGNEMTMAKIVLCDIMIRKFNGQLGFVIHMFTQWSELTESLQKVHTFYCSNEVQKGIINEIPTGKANQEESKLREDVALKIKGNFSWGWDQQEKEEEEKKEQSQDDKKKEAEAKKDDDFKKDNDTKAGDDDKKDDAAKLDDVAEQLLQELEEETKEGDGKADKKEKKKNTFDSILTLKDIDLEIKKGEFVCIIGEIGSGKTSLLNTVIGETLYVPDEEITLAGGYDTELTPENLNGIAEHLHRLDIKP